VFQCTNFKGEYVIWNVKPLSGESSDLIMSISLHNDGEEVRHVVNPVGINGSTIRCNGQSLTMYSFNHSKFSLKAE